MCGEKCGGPVANGHDSSAQEVNWHNISRQYGVCKGCSVQHHSLGFQTKPLSSSRSEELIKAKLDTDLRVSMCLKLYKHLTTQDLF